MSMFGAAGLLIPAEVLLRWAVTGSSITTFEWCLWPSAIWYIATEVPNAGVVYTLKVLTLSVGAKHTLVRNYVCAHVAL